MKSEKKTGASRTQLAVTDEWWSDERIQTFLHLQPVAGEPADYHVLLKAYRGMEPDAFARFIAFFVAAGRNLNEPGPSGKTIVQLVAEHRHGSDYARILNNAGAL